MGEEGFSEPGGKPWAKLFSAAAIVEVLNLSDSSFSDEDLLLF